MIKLSLFRYIFFACCIGVIVASLLPVKNTTVSINLDHLDKFLHTLVYALLAFLGLKAFPLHTKGVLVGLCVMGAVIEIIQEATGWRSGEGLDLAANITGILAVYGVFQLRTVGGKE